MRRTAQGWPQSTPPEKKPSRVCCKQDGRRGPINAPTVFNSVFNVEQFWDGRAATLQDQAGGPPLNPIEMASKSWDEIIAKLEKDPQLKAQFLEVYPQGFSGENITDAIAEFEKTLITPDSPFDKWLRGDENALTAQQKKGYQLFKDNKCATCHGGIILGGRSFEPLGLKKDFNFGEITAADIGRMNVTKEERDKLRQKVPGLRNVALTAPYFHRGDGNDSNLLIVFYVQIMPDDFVMQLHRF